MPQPTPAAYAELQQAYDHFNATLFAGELPDCLITLQREKRTMGYFSSARFVHRGGQQTDELAMNPSYFGILPVRETLSTLAHEMAHAWQYHFGKPGRRGYHNLEWAAKMDELGLTPSATGKPGGKRVGERMSHYIVDGGAFDVAYADLMTRAFRLSWLDRFPPVDPSLVTLFISGDDDDDDQDGHDLEGEDERQQGRGNAEVEEALGLMVMPEPGLVNRSNRAKYRCPSCAVQVWGKPGLVVLCGEGDCRRVALDAVD